MGSAEDARAIGRTSSTGKVDVRTNRLLVDHTARSPTLPVLRHRPGQACDRTCPPQGDPQPRRTRTASVWGDARAARITHRTVEATSLCPSRRSRLRAVPTSCSPLATRHSIAFGGTRGRPAARHGHARRAAGGGRSTGNDQHSRNGRQSADRGKGSAVTLGGSPASSSCLPGRTHAASGTLARPLARLVAPDDGGLERRTIRDRQRGRGREWHPTRIPDTHRTIPPGRPRRPAAPCCSSSCG